MGDVRYWTKDKVLAEIKRVIRKAELNRERPKVTSLRGGAKCYVGEYFGGWNKALIAAGYTESKKVLARRSRAPVTLCNGNGYSQSICWDCKNAYAHRCGWFSAGTKPKGAIFESRKVAENGRHKGRNVYACVSCPNFEPDGGKPNTKLDDEGVERLIYAIVASAAKEIRKYPTRSDSAKSFFKSDWFEELTGLDGRRALREVMKVD